LYWPWISFHLPEHVSEISTSTMKFLTAACALVFVSHRVDAALGGPKDPAEDVEVMEEKDQSSSSWGSFRQMLAPIFGTNDEHEEKDHHQQMLMLVDQDYDEDENEDEHVLPRRGLSYYYNRYYHNRGGYHNGYGRSHGYGYGYDNDSYDNSYDGYGYGHGRSYSYGRQGGRTHYRYGYDNDGYSYDNGYD
jgi:hypothetical protein